MGLIGCLRLLLIRSLGFRAKVIGSRALVASGFRFQRIELCSKYYRGLNNSNRVWGAHYTITINPAK